MRATYHQTVSYALDGRTSREQINGEMQKHWPQRVRTGRSCHDEPIDDRDHPSNLYRRI